MAIQSKDQLDLARLPRHIAIIMDGNGRWAKQQGKNRIFGHRAGVKTVHRITEACAELGIGYLTLYAFSTENWKRPSFEVNALMNLLIETLRQELNVLLKNNIRLVSIGDLSQLPRATRTVLVDGIRRTEQNTGMTLVIALNYSARWDILRASEAIAQEYEMGKLDFPLSQERFSGYLSTSGIPDPELLIRTSGEIRISNFLLWELAYSELFFTETPWPAFSVEDLYQAIYNFQNRERRFGMTSEQLKSS